MATVETKQKFIELRANNESYASIAKKLGVSKTTLISWAKDCETEIRNLRAITFESLQEQYKIGKQHELQLWSEQLEMARKELTKRSYSDVPTLKLIELLDNFTEKLNNLATRVQFQSEEYEDGFTANSIALKKRDYWSG